MIEGSEILEMLSRLVDRSLVTYDEESGRYVLLETVRQYAAEHALDSDEYEALREEHFAFFVEFTNVARKHVRGPDQLDWLKRMDADYDNIRLALEWGLSTDANFETTLLMAGRLIDYWAIRGMYSETNTWEHELETKGTDWTPASKARLLLLGSATRHFLGKTDIAKTAEALRLARESGLPQLIGHALNNMSLDCVALGMHEDARKYGEEGIPLLEKLGDWTNAAFTHIHLGNSAYALGDLDDAETHYREGLRLRLKLKDLRGVGAALASLALVEDMKGDADQAVQLIRQALGAFSKVGSDWDLAGAMPIACIELSRQGRYRESAMMLGCSDSLLAKVRGARDVADRKMFARWSEATKSVLGKDEYEAAYRIGRDMSAQAAIALAFPEGVEVPSLEAEEDS